MEKALYLKEHNRLGDILHRDKQTLEQLLNTELRSRQQPLMLTKKIDLAKSIQVIIPSVCEHKEV